MKTYVRIIRLCDNLDCWNLVERIPSQIYLKHHFCCHKCHGQWLKVGNNSHLKDPEVVAKNIERMKSDKNPMKNPISVAKVVERLRNSKERGSKISASLMGHEVTADTRKKMSIKAIERFKDPDYLEKFQGPNSSQWNGGTCPESYKEAMKREARVWRKAVLERDNYTCQDCGDKPERSKYKIHAHHIKPQDEYPELKFDVSNGKTLCSRCHLKYRRWIRKPKVQLSFITPVPI